MIAGWRFALRGAAPAALLASMVAVWMAVHGLGRFNGDSLLAEMITLQAFNVGLAVSSFLLVAFVETERRKQEVSQMYMAAQLASEAKSAFLNMAAHELRTPISVLHGYLSLLTDGSLGAVPPHVRKAVDILTAKTNELNKIVGDLLEASQIEARALPRNATVLDVRAVVSAAVERAQPRAALLGGEISATLASRDLPVEADAEQVGRILDNLINNALTYTDQAPQVAVSVAGENGSAIIRVRDNGVGIPADQVERIFDRFQRANEPRFRNVRGTGLGLYISRELAQGHRGTLCVEHSQPGLGTVFALTLPLAVPAPVG
jgi:signal transduction histidine kinase